MLTWTTTEMWLWYVFANITAAMRQKRCRRAKEDGNG